MDESREGLSGLTPKENPYNQAGAGGVIKNNKEKDAGVKPPVEVDGRVPVGGGSGQGSAG